MTQCDIIVFLDIKTSLHLLIVTSITRFVSIKSPKFGSDI